MREDVGKETQELLEQISARHARVAATAVNDLPSKRLLQLVWRDGFVTAGAIQDLLFSS